MARIAKLFLFLILALVILVAAAVFVITRIIDPNDYKEDIAALAKEHANIELNLAGDIGWTFWPSLGLSVGRTEAHIVDQEPLFAAIDHFEVGVALLPLFKGQVEMDAIRIDGMELHLIQTADGGNWEALLPDESEKEDTRSADDSTEALEVPVSIPLVSITNSRLRFQDLTNDTDISIEQLELEARDVSLTEDFPLLLSLRYQDQDDTLVELALDTRVNLDLTANQYRLSPLMAEVTLAGLTTHPVEAKLNASVLADLEKDQIDISNLTLAALGTDTTGAISVHNMSESFSFSGRIRTAPFDANKVLKALGEAPIETADPNALSNVSLDATLTGPANSLIMDPLMITLDDSTIKGKAGITDIEALALMFDLTMDHITLDGYLPPEDESQAREETRQDDTQETVSLSTEPLLPLEELRELNVKGKLLIDTLVFDDLNLSDVAVEVDAARGVLVQNSKGKVLDGGFNTHLTLDARTDTPQIQARLASDKVQIQKLVNAVLGRDLLTGMVDVNANITTQGNSEKDLYENLNGKFNVGVIDAIVRGVNLHSALVDGINDMLSKVPALANVITGIDPSKLPRELRDDTKILDLVADTRLEKGVAYVDNLLANLERGARVKGGGWLNLANDDFDFDMRLLTGEISDNEFIQSREWPIRCAGNLNGSAARWCLPNKNKFKDEGEALVKQLAKDKLGIDEERVAEEKAKLKAKADEEKAKLEARKEEEKAKLDKKIEDSKSKAKDKVKDKLKGLF